MTQPHPEPEQPPPSGAAQKPPPLPVAVVGYASPILPAEAAPTNKPQKVFDTVIGPNLRLKDNLIQLACVIAGGSHVPAGRFRWPPFQDYLWEMWEISALVFHHQSSSTFPAVTASLSSQMSVAKYRSVVMSKWITS